MTNKNKKHLTANDAKLFREALLERRNVLLGSVHHMEDEALKKSRIVASGDLSAVPYHMADLGTDNYEQEFTLELIQNEEEELREVNAAIARLEDGTFGLCTGCEKQILKTRLKAIPYARLCIECKREEEETAGPG